MLASPGGVGGGLRQLAGRPLRRSLLLLLWLCMVYGVFHLVIRDGSSGGESSSSSGIVSSLRLNAILNYEPPELFPSPSSSSSSSIMDLSSSSASPKVSHELVFVGAAAGTLKLTLLPLSVVCEQYHGRCQDYGEFGLSH